MAKNFTVEQSEDLLNQSSLPPAERTCPSCGHVGLRFYFQASPGKEKIYSYLWCPRCRAFSGSTGPALGRTVDYDPLSHLDENELLQLDLNLEKFFRVLDRYWESGKLPQRIP